MIVTTRRQDILRGKPVIAIVCSTSFEEPLLPVEIQLPFDPQRQSVTQLSEPTVAVCDWVVEIPRSAIQQTGGFVPTALLRTICQTAGITHAPER
jgi:hypothetical protein